MFISILGDCVVAALADWRTLPPIVGALLLALFVVRRARLARRSGWEGAARWRTVTHVGGAIVVLASAEVLWGWLRFSDHVASGMPSPRVLSDAMTQVVGCGLALALAAGATLMGQRVESRIARNEIAAAAGSERDTWAPTEAEERSVPLLLGTLAVAGIAAALAIVQAVL